MLYCFSFEWTSFLKKLFKIIISPKGFKSLYLVIQYGLVDTFSLKILVNFSFFSFRCLCIRLIVSNSVNHFCYLFRIVFVPHLHRHHFFWRQQIQTAYNTHFNKVLWFPLVDWDKFLFISFSFSEKKVRFDVWPKKNYCSWNVTNFKIKTNVS